jgi:hypothetical protein
MVGTNFNSWNSNSNFKTIPCFWNISELCPSLHSYWRLGDWTPSSMVVRAFLQKKNKYPGRHWLSKPESLSTERVGMVSIRGSCMEAGIMGSMCGKTAHAKPEWDSKVLWGFITLITLSYHIWWWNDTIFMKKEMKIDSCWWNRSNLFLMS